MKSVENILGYIQEQFNRFSRGCKPRKNLWNCSRKYSKMFETDSFLGSKKLSLNQNFWRDHATMQQDVLLHFWVMFLYWNFCCPAVELISLPTPMENGAVCQLKSFLIVYRHFFIVYPCGQQWGYMEKSCKMQQMCIVCLSKLPHFWSISLHGCLALKTQWNKLFAPCLNWIRLQVVN